MDYNETKRKIFWIICILTAVRLWSPFAFVPKPLEDAVPAILDFVGLGARGFADFQRVFIMIFVFLNIVSIPYGAIRGKKNIEELESDDGTLAGKTYVSALNLLVSEVYLFTIALIGTAVSFFTPLAYSGEYQLAVVYGIVFVFSLSQATGWGVFGRKAKSRVEEGKKTRDPAQEPLEKYV